MAKSNRDLSEQSTQTDNTVDEKKDHVALRHYVRVLYFERKISKSAIARSLGVSRNFVAHWTAETDMNVSDDHRGWPKGKARRYDTQTQQRVAAVHRELSDDPQEFFTGATAVQLRWPQHYAEAAPSLRTIGRILKELGVTTTPKRSSRGAAAYLLYPEQTIYGGALGERVLEMDFVGKKFLSGVSTPLHFVSFSFKHSPKLRLFRRVEAETSTVAITQAEWFLHTYERPALIKVDNAAATIGSVSAKRTISRFVAALHRQHVNVCFSVPRKPFSQASVEGNNSVFARRFWNQRTFTSLEDVDLQLEWFNRSSERYCQYRPPQTPLPSTQPFLPRIYFLRQVREDPATKTGFVSVVNETIPLSPAWIRYFVLAEWQIDEERLLLWLENKDGRHVIDSRPFPINCNAKFTPD